MIFFHFQNTHQDRHFKSVATVKSYLENLHKSRENDPAWQEFDMVDPLEVMIDCLSESDISFGSADNKVVEAVLDGTQIKQDENIGTGTPLPCYHFTFKVGVPFYYREYQYSFNCDKKGYNKFLCLLALGDLLGIYWESVNRDSHKLVDFTGWIFEDNSTTIKDKIHLVKQEITKLPSAA